MPSTTEIFFAIFVVISFSVVVHIHLLLGAYEQKIKKLEGKIGKLEQKPTPAPDSKLLETPSVSSTIDTGFPAEKTYNMRLFDIAINENKNVWVAGASPELKLFDLQGNLLRTVPIPIWGVYICMYNDHVVLSDQVNKFVKKVFENGTVATMFSTGEWEPYGITGTASGDLLVCLYKDGQSKVVQYSRNGTKLKEIQKDPKGQPLYQRAWYIAENVNGDVIVTDFENKIVTTVNEDGLFRFSYSGKQNFSADGVVTDSSGHVYVTDFEGDKIHMLDRDGQFLSYINPKGGIESPRALALINDNEMIVGECRTGLAKTFKFLEEKK